MLYPMQVVEMADRRTDMRECADEEFADLLTQSGAGPECIALGARSS